MFGDPVGLVEFAIDIENFFHFVRSPIVATDQNAFPFHFFFCVV